MKIEIVNQQKVKRINLKSLRRQLNKISTLLNLSSSKISIVLCDNKAITNLNRKYFKKASSTDVISFPLKDNFDPDYLGEVVVSVEEAVEATRRVASTTWWDELLLYIIHGILHLIGYDDRNKKERGQMEKKQQELLHKILHKI